jgi:transposase-like protein
MEKILDTLQEIDPDREGNCAERLISDFEEGILRALHNAFPGAHARGCWFHYGQVGFNISKFDSRLSYQNCLYFRQSIEEPVTRAWLDLIEQVQL